jgi:hypothetical protein
LCGTDDDLDSFIKLVNSLKQGSQRPLMTMHDIAHFLTNTRDVLVTFDGKSLSDENNQLAALRKQNADLRKWLDEKPQVHPWMSVRFKNTALEEATNRDLTRAQEVRNFLIKSKGASDAIKNARVSERQHRGARLPDNGKGQWRQWLVGATGPVRNEYRVDVGGALSYVLEDGEKLMLADAEQQLGCDCGQDNCLSYVDLPSY